MEEEVGSVVKWQPSLQVACLSAVLAGALVSAPATAAVAVENLMDDSTASMVFRGLKDGDGRPLSGQIYAAWKGHFTSPARNEAVVLLTAASSHAGGWVEAWLLRHGAAGWRPIERLGRSDDIEVDFCDVEGRGVDAVLIQQRHGGQGIEDEDGALYTWRDGKEEVLYAYSDWADQLPAHHEISFADLNRDGVREIVDEHQKDGSVFVFRLVRHAYRFDRGLTRRYEDMQILAAPSEVDSGQHP